MGHTPFTVTNDPKVVLLFAIFLLFPTASGCHAHWSLISRSKMLPSDVCLCVCDEPNNLLLFHHQTQTHDSISLDLPMKNAGRSFKRCLLRAVSLALSLSLSQHECLYSASLCSCSIFNTSNAFANSFSNQLWSLRMRKKNRIFNSFGLCHFRRTFFFSFVASICWVSSLQERVEIKLKWMFSVRVPDIKSENSLLQVSSQLSTCNTE